MEAMFSSHKKQNRITLAFQGLEEIPDKMLKRELTTDVEELDLSHNQIQDFLFLLHLQNLQTLILDHNGLQSHVKFPVLPKLHTLWVNHNNITNLSVFVSTISQCFPNLRYLSMMNNEAAPSFFNGGTYVQYSDYRQYVISQLPHLETLDDTPVVKTERSEAERIYASILPGWHS